MSTGAKAGIGASVGDGVLIILGAFIAIVRKTGRQKRKREQPVPQDVQETSDYSNQRTSWVEYKSELNAKEQHRQQLEDTRVSKTAAHELPPADPAATLSKRTNALQRSRALSPVAS